MGLTEGFSVREVFKKSKWKFKMAFAIRHPTPPPLMAKFPDIFSPHFFSFATESYIQGVFLAVQDSSIGDIVSQSLSQ